MRYVVGAPHAFCNYRLKEEIRRGRGHMCDLVTRPIAERVGELLDAKVFLSPRERVMGSDLNRAETLGDPWRVALEKELDRETVYVDVHSYPSWDDDWGRYDVVLLLEQVCPRWLTWGVKNELQRRGYKVGIYAGKDNSLVRRACHERGAFGAVLVEVNERFHGSEGRVAEAIAAAVRAARP